MSDGNEDRDRFVDRMMERDVDAAPLTPAEIRQLRKDMKDREHATWFWKRVWTMLPWTIGVGAGAWAFWQWLVGLASKGH